MFGQAAGRVLRPATLAVAAALHHLVEKPIERRLRRIPVGA